VIQDIETEVHLSLVPTLDPDPLVPGLGPSATEDGDQTAIPAADPLRVLIVDDAPSTRRFLRAVLEHCVDFDVVGEAAEGEAAVERAGVLQPDLVLLDLLMPMVHGTEALNRILQVAPKAIVIVVSGMNPSVEGLMLDAGAKAFVPKGLAPYDLIDRLGSILGRSITLGSRADADEMDRSLADTASGPTVLDRSHRRAVVLESDPMICHLITKALKNCDVDVVAETHSPSTVLAVVDLSQPALVVLDLSLDGAPDTTVLAEISRRSPRSVIVVYSEFEDWKDEALAAGATAFVAKPRIDELTDTICQLTPNR